MSITSPPIFARNHGIWETYSRMYFQEKSPYAKDRPHEREGRESRDKQYPFLYLINSIT